MGNKNGGGSLPTMGEDTTGEIFEETGRPQAQNNTDLGDKRLSSLYENLHNQYGDNFEVTQEVELNIGDTTASLNLLRNSEGEVINGESYWEGEERPTFENRQNMDEVETLEQIISNSWAWPDIEEYTFDHNPGEPFRIRAWRNDDRNTPYIVSVNVKSNTVNK